MKKQNSNLANFIKKIKENKKYSSLSDDIIKKEINNYMKKYQFEQDEIYDDKFALKIIRKELHRLYSSYQTKGKKKRDNLLKELKLAINNKEETKKIIEKILSTTLSGIERIDKYENLYKNIFKLTGKPKIILDLGSGLNPISSLFMDLKKLNYYSYDIDLDDIKFLNNFFTITKKLGIKGKAAELDIREIDKLKKLPTSDLIFLFKVYDLIVPKGKKGKGFGEKIINTLMTKTNYLLVSFATKTLTRKSMKLPRRVGFEMMLDRNQLKYELIETDNEIYYVIRKN